LSSTRSANHDRVKSARDSAGQPLNRVFERHRIGEEIAAEEVGGEDLAVIHGDDWRHIVGIPGLASLILDRIERGRLATVNELLTRLNS
jgi:hypothetical protein